jgi:hypothetical protein
MAAIAANAILKKDRLPAIPAPEQPHEKPPGVSVRGYMGANRGMTIDYATGGLLNLGFLELDVLAHDRIVLVELQFLRLRARILLGHIEVTGVSGGNELNLNDVRLCHDESPGAPYGAGWAVSSSLV